MSGQNLSIGWAILIIYPMGALSQMHPRTQRTAEDLEVFLSSLLVRPYARLSKQYERTAEIPYVSYGRRGARVEPWNNDAVGSGIKFHLNAVGSSIVHCDVIRCREVRRSVGEKK